MDDAEVKKTCRSCGKDLRHKKRCKSRDGTYLCPKCFESENRWDRRTVGKLADKKLWWFILWAVIAAIACIVFWKILDVVSSLNLEL